MTFTEILTKISTIQRRDTTSVELYRELEDVKDGIMRYGIDQFSKGVDQTREIYSPKKEVSK